MASLNIQSRLQTTKQAGRLIIKKAAIRLCLPTAAMLLLLSPTVFAEEAGATVEEAFETELGESMEIGRASCRERV